MQDNTEQFDEILNQFSTGKELNDFLKALQKRGIEKMLEGEFNDHLGYDKHQKSPATNVRNGTTKKTIRTSFGESQIQVPRDRDSSFNPMIVPKRQSMVDGLENVIVWVNSKIEGMFFYDFLKKITSK